jgi:hypothetical protein
LGLTQGMSELAHWLGILLLLLGCLLALLSLVLGLPGAFLLVLVAALYGWATGFVAVTWATLAGLLAAAVVAEIIEFASAAGGGSDPALKPSRRITVLAIIGAIVGAIFGAPLFLGLGALLGAFAGAFGGAALGAISEGQNRDDAVRHGLRALRGRVLGFIVKTAIATAMTIWLVVTVL